jgi:hypothetical protein
MVAIMTTPAASAGWTRILNQARLHDGTVMQAFARPSATGSWYFAQVTEGGRFGQSHDFHLAHGDLTLTHLAADGTRVLSWMFLRGFGHGVSIATELDDGGAWIWIEAVSANDPDGVNPDGFGTKVARFRWKAGATITAAAVALYDPHPRTLRNGPSLAGPLVAARYTTLDGEHATDVYGKAAFLARDFSEPLAHLPKPPGMGTGQGWRLLPGGDRIALLTGDAYSPSNPPPGNATMTIYDAAGVVSSEHLTAGAALTWHEPEGVAIIGGRLCYGLASGDAGARRATVYSRPL